MLACRTAGTLLLRLWLCLRYCYWLAWHGCVCWRFKVDLALRFHELAFGFQHAKLAIHDIKNFRLQLGEPDLRSVVGVPPRRLPAAASDPEMMRWMPGPRA
jgi:hypothetical protein